MFASSSFIALVLVPWQSPSLCLLEFAGREFAGSCFPEPDAVLLVISLADVLFFCLLGDGLLALCGLRCSRTRRLLRDSSLVRVLVDRAECELGLVALSLGLLVLDSDLVLLGA